MGNDFRRTAIGQRTLWLALVGLLLSGGALQSRADDKPVPTYANVHYGPHNSQVLDFYQAKSDKPTPVLFFVHGGGWMNGDKGKPDFLKQCLDAGISVASINYRLIPEAKNEPRFDPKNENREPVVVACLEDSARALQFVRSKAKEWNIDPTRIAGCGGSAGGYTVLWLAFHDDMADPKSSDPVARESTRLSAVMAFVPQTSIDPKQMRDWIPNNHYGNHAFLLPSYDSFLEKREELMPWIKKLSPYELASADDPPVYLYYDSAADMGKPFKDPTHSANFGAGLAEKLDEVGVVYEFNHRGATDVKHPDIFGFLVENLKEPEAK